MISPSTTHFSGRLASAASRISGKYRVIGFSLRLPISTRSPDRKTIDRKPSHFGSKLTSSPSSASIPLTGLASMGATGGTTGIPHRSRSSASRSALGARYSASALSDRRLLGCTRGGSPGIFG